MTLTKTIIFILSLIASSTYVLSMDTIRFAPKHKGVDPKLAEYVEEYLGLAEQNGIKFTHSVSVGFEDLKSDHFVGIAYQSTSWREVVIDRKSWKGYTEMSRKNLLFHELDHAYCDRNHDYGLGKNYGKPYAPVKAYTKENGYFPDHCPLSIMHPSMFEDDCFVVHYLEYVSEMFERCRAF